MARVQEVYSLPSGGRVAGVPEKITIQNITTREEKMLLGSPDEAFDSIIKSCVVEPKDFRLEDLTTTDRHFLLMKLRIISYGPIYPFPHRCPFCQQISEYEINLDELENKVLPEEFEEPYDTFDLPSSKTEISLRLPRVGEFNKIKIQAKRYNKKFPEAVGDISYIFSLMLNIHSVSKKLTSVPSEDGGISQGELQKFVEELSGMDSSYIRNRIAELDFGIDTTIIRECKRCQEDLEFPLTLGSEFFHTRLGQSTRPTN
jgi:hypothetical protein